MQYQLYQLHFNAPLHLNHGKHDAYDNSEKFLHSDTLMAAIYAVANKWYATDSLVNALEFMQGISVSSAFPFYQEQLFFPKPMMRLNLNFGDEQSPFLSKQLKKIEWISQIIFFKLLQNKSLSLSSDLLSRSGSFLCSQAINTNIFNCQTQQKLNKKEHELPQVDPMPFYLERIYFEKNAGLYFLAQFEDDKYQKQFEIYLRMLGDEGIGTDRHSGNGTFSVSSKSINLPAKSNAKQYINLSTFCPTIADLQHIELNESAYKLLKRGGYMAGSSQSVLQSFRKKTIYMFTEGSVFFTEQKPIGKVVDLQPTQIDETLTAKLHPVYRSGKAIMLPIL